MKLVNKNILVTGGTGSFGRAFVRKITQMRGFSGRLVVFSRDELKQFEMSQEFSPTAFPGIRYFIGDVRDKDRLSRAMDGIDVVIHAAALKQVPATEYNPFECIKTNVLGAQNVIEAAIETGVSRVVALSTDKAAAPINLYGATKLCSDKLFVSANNITGKSDKKFIVVRYGNVMGSRGSVIPFFMKHQKLGFLPITNPEMTRFNITLDAGVNMVLWAIENGQGGEIFVPKIPSYKITDLALAINPDCEQRITGIRPGEKIHEEMITTSDSLNTVDLGAYYAILSQSCGYTTQDYCSVTNAFPVEPGFSYNSGDNPHFLTVQELQKLIDENVVLAAP